MIPKTHIIVLGSALVLLQAVALVWLGRPLIGSGNSESLLDGYSLSHIVYGFILYFVLWLVNKKLHLPIGVLFLIILVISMGWEVYENTAFAINRYQTETISTNYYGDSVLNSIIDTAVLGFGFLAAWYLPTWLIITVAVALELAMLTTIHDSLLLNIIMFTHPFPAIKHWQAALTP